MSSDDYDPDKFNRWLENKFDDIDKVIKLANEYAAVHLTETLKNNTPLTAPNFEMWLQEKCAREQAEKMPLTQSYEASASLTISSTEDLSHMFDEDLI